MLLAPYGTRVVAISRAVGGLPSGVKNPLQSTTTNTCPIGSPSSVEVVTTATVRPHWSEASRLLAIVVEEVPAGDRLCDRTADATSGARNTPQSFPIDQRCPLRVILGDLVTEQAVPLASGDSFGCPFGRLASRLDEGLRHRSIIDGLLVILPA